MHNILHGKISLLEDEGIKLIGTGPASSTTFSPTVIQK